MEKGPFCKHCGVHIDWDRDTHINVTGTDRVHGYAGVYTDGSGNIQYDVDDYESDYGVEWDTFSCSECGYETSRLEDLVEIREVHYYRIEQLLDGDWDFYDEGYEWDAACDEAHYATHKGEITVRLVREADDKIMWQGNTIGSCPGDEPRDQPNTTVTAASSVINAVYSGSSGSTNVTAVKIEMMPPSTTPLADEMIGSLRDPD